MKAFSQNIIQFVFLQPFYINNAQLLTQAFCFVLSSIVIEDSITSSTIVWNTCSLLIRTCFAFAWINQTINDGYSIRTSSAWLRKYCFVHYYKLQHTITLSVMKIILCSINYLNFDMFPGHQLVEFCQYIVNLPHR